MASTRDTAMKGATAIFVGELETCEPFARVGIDQDDKHVAWASLWSEAVKTVQSKASRYAAIGSRNVLTERLCFEFIERYRQWNKITLEINKLSYRW
jgi:hypothetical protein